MKKIGDKQYDEILKLCQELFLNVELDTEQHRIIIRDKTTFTICYSFNEFKIYISPGIDALYQLTKIDFVPNEIDNHLYKNEAKSTRLMDMQSIKAYLYLKHTECLFLKTYKG